MVIQDLTPRNSILPYQPIHQPSTVTTETEYDESGRITRRIVTTSHPQRINPNHYYNPSYPGWTVWCGTSAPQPMFGGVLTVNS